MTSTDDKVPEKSHKSVSFDEESGDVKLIQRATRQRQQKQISMRRLQFVEKERIEVSLLHHNEYIAAFADFFDDWFVFARETDNVAKRAGAVLLLAFMALAYVTVRLIYHLLRNIKTQIIYIVYDYTNLNLSSYNRMFQKPDLRYDVRKKIALDDDAVSSKTPWFCSRYVLYHLNLMAKRYHFVLLCAGMLIFTATDAGSTFYLSLDLSFGINVNQKLFTFLQIIIAVAVGYLNVSRSDKVRKDLTSFIRSITRRNEKIIDSNHTMLKTVDEVVADLRYYGFVHLRTQDENDIILSTTGFKTFNVSELRELIVDGVILLNGAQFRFLTVSENTLEGEEDISLHIYFYNYYNQWLAKVHNVTLGDLRLIDTFTVFLLFLYFFTSLDLQGYFFVLFAALLAVFFLLLFIRRQENRAYSFAWFDRHALKWVRNKANAKLESEEEATVNSYLARVIEQNYFRLICRQLDDYRLRYITTSTASTNSKLTWQEGLADIKPRDCLLFFAVKNGFNLSYQFDRMGFQLHDFIRFMNDVSYHYKFSLTMKTEGRTIYHLENPDSTKDTLVVELAADGLLLSCSFVENYVSDAVHKKMGWQLLWSDLYVT